MAYTQVRAPISGVSGLRVRMLHRNLAFGMGLNTAVFSVVNAVLITALPYRRAERLVWMTEYDAVLKTEIIRGVDFLDSPVVATYNTPGDRRMYWRPGVV